MVDEINLGGEFFRLLEEFDKGVARRVAEAGCPWCEGPLHRGDYARKPRGALIAPAGETSVVRFSLCCGREGCRRRATPPSLRFLGRRVYLGVVVIVASLVAQWLGTAEASRPVTGVPARTTRRWVGWWRGPFIETEVFLRSARGWLGWRSASCRRRSSPSSGSWPQRVRAALELLAPLTTGSLPAGSPFLRVTA